MSKKLSWDQIAKAEFDRMDTNYQADWQELRHIVYGE